MQPWINKFISSTLNLQLPIVEEDVDFKSPKIAFGVLSSTDSTLAIDKIAKAVFPHFVYVHHDFSKYAHFSPTASNVHVLNNPVTTAWGDWSLVEASSKLMEKALEDSEVTHFQLLSESCRLVYPIQEFEDYLKHNRPDIMVDMTPVDNDDMIFSHGWRYLANSNLGLKIARRASLWASGGEGNYSHLQVHSINIRLAGTPETLKGKIAQFFGKIILRSMMCLTLLKLANSGIKQMAVGSQWFAVSRRAAIWVIRTRHQFTKVTQHFQNCPIPDEAYLHTLFLMAQTANLPLRKHAGNHVLFWDNAGRSPDILSEKDRERIRASKGFFARKFLLEDDFI